MGPDPVVSAATETFVKEALTRLFGAIDSWRVRRRDKKKGEVTVDEGAVEKHLRAVIPWSERVTPLGAPEGKGTERSTVSMDIDMPRRYGWRDGQRRDEATLLTSEQNLVILGDPGAGKTTTVKRLVRHLLSPERDRSDTASFPVVIRCAELDRNRLLEEALADVFGIDHRRHVVDTGTDEGKVGETSLSQFHVVALAAIGPPFVIPNKRNLPIELQLSDTLDASGALVLIDGLDETPQFLREETHRALTSLVHMARNTRFRVTCRPGYFTSLDGFDSVQLCPLTGEQIAEIARKWCRDPDGFLAALGELPFRDVATLPLFLLQLIAIFDSSGFAGIQATSVYRVVIHTALRKWDEHKRLKPRVSQYAAFDADNKFKFLCHLAFHLMYTLHKTQFSTEDLARVYWMICEPFGLPPQQEQQVARELESHTGIFVQSGADRYEFAHLSMQEYLCAEFLLGVPMDKYAEMIGHSMEPVAVAAAMTSNPSEWFSALILRDAVWRHVPMNTGPFFARLLLAADKFVPAASLGYAALRFIFRATAQNAVLDEHTERFLRLPAVEQSIASVLKNYDVMFDGKRYTFTDYASTSTADMHVPIAGTMWKERVAGIRQRHPFKFKSYVRDPRF